MPEYTQDQIYAAIRAADKAGDSEGVRKLAGYLRTVQQPQAPKKTVSDRALKPQSAITTGINAISKGATAGLDNYIAAAPSALVGKYNQTLSNLQAQDAANAKAHPTINALAEFAGGVASPINKVGKLFKGAGWAAKAARIAVPAAVYGGVSGAANTQGNAMQRLKAGGEGAATSAVFAGLGVPAGKVLGAGAKTLSPKFSPGVKRLLDMGVNLTPGQLAGKAAKTAEDKLMSLPGVGALIKSARQRSIVDWNRGMLASVLETVGLHHDGSVGHEGIAHVQQALGAKYDALLPKLKMAVDTKLQTDVQEVARHVTELPPDVQSVFGQVFSNRVMPRVQGKTELNGAEVKQIESELGTVARQYSASADPAHRALASNLNDLIGAMRSSLERSNPLFAKQLKPLNMAYAQFKRLQDATARRATSHGIFTPGDLLASAKKLDRSAGKGSFARGDALLQREAEQAHKILPSEVPNSGTADRAAGIAALIESPHLLAAAAAHPVAAAGAGLAASAYTSPGMKLVNAAARSTPGKARNALAKLMQRAGPALPVAGGVAGAQLFNAGGQ